MLGNKFYAANKRLFLDSEPEVPDFNQFKAQVRQMLDISPLNSQNPEQRDFCIKKKSPQSGQISQIPTTSFQKVKTEPDDLTGPANHYVLFLLKRQFSKVLLPNIRSVDENIQRNLQKFDQNRHEKLHSSKSNQNLSKSQIFEPYSQQNPQFWGSKAAKLSLSQKFGMLPELRNNNSSYEFNQPKYRQNIPHKEISEKQQRQGKRHFDSKQTQVAKLFNDKFYAFQGSLPSPLKANQKKRKNSNRLNSSVSEKIPRKQPEREFDKGILRTQHSRRLKPKGFRVQFRTTTQSTDFQVKEQEQMHEADKIHRQTKKTFQGELYQQYNNQFQLANKRLTELKQAQHLHHQLIPNDYRKAIMKRVQHKSRLQKKRFKLERLLSKSETQMGLGYQFD